MRLNSAAHNGVLQHIAVTPGKVIAPLEHAAACLLQTSAGRCGRDVGEREHGHDFEANRLPSR